MPTVTVSLQQEDEDCKGCQQSLSVYNRRMKIAKDAKGSLSVYNRRMKIAKDVANSHYQFATGG